MLVRDIIVATSRAGEVSVEMLLTDRALGVVRLRALGLHVSSRLTVSSWPKLGRIWGRQRGAAQIAALKAEARIAARDPETLRLLAAILLELGVGALPTARPETAGPRLRPATLRSQIARTEVRLAGLRAQLSVLEGASA